MQEDGKTLLLRAIDHGQIDCIKELVIAGADLNFYSKELCVTPLIFALYQSRHDCMEVLLELGADANFQSEEVPVPPLILGKCSIS